MNCRLSYNSTGIVNVHVQYDVTTNKTKPRYSSATIDRGHEESDIIA